MPRRHFFEIALVVVTTVAGRFDAELSVDMTALAIQLEMSIIQCQPHHHVLERSRFPVLVARGTLVVQFRDLLASRMT